MATYKLIQDIEAEDHILGPLTLRQFIFGLVAAFCWYLSFIIFVKHVYFLLPVTVLPGLFFSFFAIPFGRDQPTEIWALAKLRFWFKPRRRIWDQSGVKELVTITVPKKVERVLTKGYSQSEVHSRLKALANTLDTRGWAIKNVDGVDARSYGDGSDRLIDIGVAPQEVPSYDARASDDILDESSNPVAQQFQSMITRSAQEHRQHIVDELSQVEPGQAPAAGGSGGQTGGQTGGWFMSQAAPVASQLPVPGPVPGPPMAMTQAARKPQPYSNMRTLQPLGQSKQGKQDNGASSGAGTPDPAILSLANNNDLNVSTLARQAYKATHDDEPPQNEVVVSLH